MTLPIPTRVLFFRAAISLVCAANVLQAIAATDSAPASREVLAFYYTWYGPPPLHWQKVDTTRHDIEASRNYPVKGAYDSHDPSIVAWQIEQAKSHGVTGFIATWWGQRTWEDQAVPLALDVARTNNFKITVYWETAPGTGAAQQEQAVNDLTYLLTRYGTNRAFLKVDGKPVIFVYGRVMDQLPFSAWPEIIRQARAKAGEFLLIADGYSQRNAEIFDGIHTYNICDRVKGKAPAELQAWAAKHYADAVKLARGKGRIACVTVIPGYDDTKIRKPGLKADRLDGEVYKILWEEAAKAKPDWVLITSWNEWHEGSEIEPSLEYGDKYLLLTSGFTKPFLSRR